MLYGAIVCPISLHRDLRSNAVAGDDGSVVVMKRERGDYGADVEKQMLIRDLIQVTGESEDEVVIVSLQERLARLTKPVSKAERTQQVLNLLETSCRSVRKVPSQPLTRKEEDAILGYGPEGV